MNEEQFEAAFVEGLISSALRDMNATEVTREYGAREDDSLEIKVQAAARIPVNEIQVRLFVGDFDTPYIPDGLQETDL